jgi:hypothetical protein
MGLFDKVKDAADATGEKVAEEAKDMKERIADQMDAMKADAEVGRAEAERDATHAKNEYKKKLREDD